MPSRANWFSRSRLSGAARIEIYELLALLLENRELLINALREIRDVLNDTGRRTERKAEGENVDEVKIRNIRAAAVHDWVLYLKSGDESGMPLSQAVRRWVPTEEASLIQSGEATGNLSRALRDCVEGILGKGAMMGAVLAGVGYPIGLLAGAYYVMRIFAKTVVPKFAQQLDPSQWEGTARFLYLEVQAFDNFAIPGVITAAILSVVFIASLPYYCGPGRVWLDRFFPPWNIYKVIQGATFLKNIAVQSRAGIKLFDSVSNMANMATPWLRERLQAAMYGLEEGQNLGEALHNAEYAFPDTRAVQILRVLASRDGFDQTLYAFAKRWEEATVKRVQRASRVLFIIGILAMGGVAASAFLGMQGLTAMVQEHADAVSYGR